MSVAMEQQFKDRLAKHLNIQLDIVLNENRSTMLNILDKTKNWVRLSVHRMFLDAPEDVLSAIARYVRGSKKEGTKNDFLIRGYIQSNLGRFNYSHKISKDKLITKGRHYDLKVIYDSLNKRYFKNALDLNVTWFGQWKKRSRTRVIFGQYYDHLKLVKIHRLLDDSFFPEYFVSYVVYHEMLHEVIQGHVDNKGIYRTHGEDFKKREREFHDFERAHLWEKQNRSFFFR
jgi:hypothetical protein